MLTNHLTFTSHKSKIENVVRWLPVTGELRLAVDAKVEDCRLWPEGWAKGEPVGL